SSTSCIDPVPTAFFKRVFDSVSSHVLKIINTSLQTGIFPDAFKTAVVKPLLKKPNLDGNALTNYRPMSNLPFISKILENIVSVQINTFKLGHDILINRLSDCVKLVQNIHQREKVLCQAWRSCV